MSEFSIHPQLVGDCHVLGRLVSSHLLLHRNSAVPWFILVPETEATELFELPPSMRRRLTDQADELARFIRDFFGSDKINVAAIGNVVPQLHLHVIGRSRQDPCWPRPVWGNLTSGMPWTPGRLSEIVTAASDRLGLEQDVL